MKITDGNPLGSAGLAGSQRPDAPGRGPGSGAAERLPLSGDEVRLSGLAGRLSEVLRADSPARLARLERLALEVSAGRYRPPADSISRGLIEESLAGGLG
ncbi:MAG: flagellar biosynthesis anti-sigma factor FlgM [Bryobacterales bacterium]|nr:flagellar biosynthesis anti-sigma factor FlgM [Bryobacterales bacterium]